MKVDTGIGSEDVIGHMRDPLAGWPNEDLMIHAASRDKLVQSYRRAVETIDWPEFRSVFEDRENRALAAKKVRRWRGVLAVCLATFGVILAAVTPLLFPGHAALERWVGVAALMMLCVGVFAGFWPALRGGKLSEWMTNRFWAERLRQFYFQIVLANIELVARAMTDEGARQAWHDLRNRELRRFSDEHMSQVSIALRRITNDHAFAKTWIDPAWSGAVALSQPPPEGADELLGFLHRQRIGIQRDYARLNLEETTHSPDWRARLLRTCADALTVGVLFVSFALAIALMLGLDAGQTVLAAFAAVGMGMVAGLRTLEKGLRYREDLERLTWYCDALQLVDAGFDEADTDGKLRLLEQTEALCYHEMRQFLVTHAAARFA